METIGFVEHIVKMAKNFHKDHGCAGSESFETCTAEICVMANSLLKFPKKTAAQALRAIPSDKRAQASRENGKKGGRKRRCSECKEEIKPGDSWERHSYGKGRYVYCSNCAERIKQEQRETDRMEDRRYP